MTKQLSWRQRAAPKIAIVLVNTQGQTEKEIRKALHDAYPWGPRENHPYAIWCDEIRRQRKLKPPKNKAKANQPTLF